MARVPRGAGMKAVSRPALLYHGGKWKLAPWVITHMPAHRFYVEPFGGGASVLLRKPRSYGEVYNDLDSEVVNVFRILRDPERALQLTRLLRMSWSRPGARLSSLSWALALMPCTGELLRSSECGRSLLPGRRPLECAPRSSGAAQRLRRT